MPNNRRLQGYDYCHPGGYFITIKSWHRFNTFSQILNGEIILSDQGKVIEKCWLELPKHFKNTDIGAYAIMPDHFHGILIINYSLVGSKHASNLPRGVHLPSHASNLPDNIIKGTKSGSLSAILQSFKSASTKLIHYTMNSSAPIWQRSFNDHIIRDENEMKKIHDYIVNNLYFWPRDPDFQ